MPTYHPYLNLTAPIFNGSINLDLTLSSQFEPSPLPSRASSKHTSMEGVRTAYTGLEKPSRVYGKGGGRRDTATSLLPLQGRRSGIFSFLNLKRTPSASSSAKQRAPLEHGEDTLVIRDISDSTSMSSVSLDSNRPPTKEVGTNSKAGKILGIIIPVRSPSVTVQIESDAEEDESDGGLTTQTPPLPPLVSSRQRLPPVSQARAPFHRVTRSADVVSFPFLAFPFYAPPPRTPSSPRSPRPSPILVDSPSFLPNFAEDHDEDQQRRKAMAIGEAGDPREHLRRATSAPDRLELIVSQRRRALSKLEGRPQTTDDVVSHNSIDERIQEDDLESFLDYYSAGDRVEDGLKEREDGREQVEETGNAFAVRLPCRTRRLSSFPSSVTSEDPQFHASAFRQPFSTETVKSNGRWESDRLRLQDDVDTIHFAPLSPVFDEDDIVRPALAPHRLSLSEPVDDYLDLEAVEEESSEDGSTFDFPLPPCLGRNGRIVIRGHQGEAVMTGEQEEESIDREQESFLEFD